MNFSSTPAYLDSSNWQQQQNHHHHHQIIGNSSSSSNPLIPPPPRPAHAAPPPPPPLPPQPQGGGGGSIRPGSMSERARMANVPMPETALKCPRCESTNTKFCYFNNYSLSQPRHFCKTCRRYWTRGGALRSVPVGGGCRRNKRSSSSCSKSSAARSKSPASSDRQTTSTSTASTSAVSANSGGILGLTTQLSPLRFMSPLSQLSTHDHNNFTGDMMVGSTNEMNFLAGGGGMASLLSNVSGGGGGNHWLPPQMQQFPFFGAMDPPPQGVYNQLQGGESGGFLGGETSHHQMRPKFSNSLLTQLASVKMEDNPELSLSRQLLMGGMQLGNDHHWNNINANAPSWTELSSFSSSSTNN